MKALLVIIIFLLTFGVIIMIKNRSLQLIWGIPFYLVIIWVLIHIWQHEIIIEDNRIIQKFGNQTKPKIMAWDDIDYIVKDGLNDLPICRLITNSQVKPKIINISGIKNMNLLIFEIVKRAKYATVDPEFKELIERMNENKDKK